MLTSGGIIENSKSESRQAFESLLTRFTATMRGRGAAASALNPQLVQLLRRFGEVRARVEIAEREKVAAKRVFFEKTLREYAQRLVLHRRAEERTASDFNLLRTLQITGNEVRHSMVLAWLLSRVETHAQGSLGFRLFLGELRMPTAFADLPYRVRREARSEKSIVDIEIYCRGEFLIHVENKIWSKEGSDQTNREWSDVQTRAQSLALGAAPSPNRVYALYLTPNGARPINPHFRSISWRQIANVFEAFATAAKPDQVKLFAAHYAEGLRRFVIAGRTTEDDEDGEGTI